MLDHNALTEEELNLLMKFTRHQIAENAHCLAELEGRFKDHVALYKNDTYMSRIKQRDILGGIMSKLFEQLVEVRKANRVMSN